MSSRYMYQQICNTGDHPVEQGTICANSPEDAIRRAGFDWIRDDGGEIVKTRKGLGHTNAAIYIYESLTVAIGLCKPDFILKRIF